jgi:hypothetical protein
MTTTTKLLQPIPPCRDNDGFWHHPDLPTFEEGDHEAWNAYKRQQQIVTTAVSLDSEDEEHPAYQRYFEQGDPNVSDWNPLAPSGDWFLIAINDTDDGPFAWFAKRIA